MKKREFLKLMGATGAAVLASNAFASETKSEEGASASEWKNDPENKHTPRVSNKREGELSVLTIDVTKHPQTLEHYIDGVEVFDADKKKLFSAVIQPASGIANVICQLKLAAGTKVSVVSSCNKHGFYVAEVALS